MRKREWGSEGGVTWGEEVEWVEGSEEVEGEGGWRGRRWRGRGWRGRRWRGKGRDP